MNTLIIGLGNPILGDDGVGWKVASELQRKEILPPNVTIECVAVGGISLMEAMIGYDRAILIDAIVTHHDPLGRVKCFKLEELPFPSSGHMGSPHDTSLQNALRVGRELGAHLPVDISVVTIESQNVYDFSEQLTPSVAAAVPEAVEIIRQILIESGTAKTPSIYDQSS